MSWELVKKDHRQILYHAGHVDAEIASRLNSGKPTLYADRRVVARTGSVTAGLHRRLAFLQ